MDASFAAVMEPKRKATYARTLEVLALEGSRWVVAEAHGGTDVVRVEPFAAVELEMARLWID
jgi:hypothetical protein